MTFLSWETYRVRGVYSKPFYEVLGLIIDIFCGIGLLFVEDCALSIFFKSWVLVASYLCSRFHIFDKPILEEYVSQVEGGPHLL